MKTEGSVIKFCELLVTRGVELTEWPITDEHTVSCFAETENYAAWSRLKNMEFAGTGVVE